jgi:hypothetical protein
MDFFYKKEKKIDTLNSWFLFDSTKFKRTKRKFWNLKINFCEVISHKSQNSFTYIFFHHDNLLQKETNCYYCCSVLKPNRFGFAAVVVDFIDFFVDVLRLLMLLFLLLLLVVSWFIYFLFFLLGWFGLIWS